MIVVEATVKLDDVRSAGLCVPGARAWARQHGIDWRAFLRHGVSAAVLAASGDPMAMRAVEAARGRRP